MRLALRAIAISALVLTLSPQVFASSETGGSRFQFFNLGEASPPDSGYRIHANLGVGYGLLSGESYQGSPSGQYLLGTAGFGRRTHHWEWDMGMGWGYSRRAGVDKAGNPVAISIRSGRTDFSARYRIFNSWQVGPIVALTFGTDTHYDLQIGDAVGTFYGGLKTTVDIAHFGAVPLEAWAEVLTELSSPGRDAFTSIIGLRMSLPVAMKRTTDQVVLSHAEPRRDVRIVLDSNRVFFRTSSAKIKPGVSEALNELASYLSKYPDRWESVQISGHADKRGSLQYNLKLSQKRADSVEKALLARGIDAGRIQVESYGPSRPLDPSDGPLAYAKNRRVELVFKNVSDADPLLQKLTPLKAGPGLDKEGPQ